MMLITGATGKLGQAVVERLETITDKSNFILMTTDLAKAENYIQKGFEVRQGDFDDMESLEIAFKGIDKLLMISTMSQERFAQQKNAIDVAKRKGIKHIVYTSLAIRDIETSHVKEIMNSHFLTEKYLIESGLRYTILRNTMYADALLDIVGDLNQVDQITLPGGTGLVPYALRQEMGEATANLLIQDNHENKIYNIVGDTLYSYQDVAEILSQVRGEKIVYYDISEIQYKDKLEQLSYPEFAIYFTMGTVIDIKEKQYEIKDKMLSELLGRPTKDMIQILRSLVNK